jgi:hypothetical protein
MFDTEHFVTVKIPCYRCPKIGEVDVPLTAIADKTFSKYLPTKWTTKRDYQFVMVCCEDCSKDW